MTDYLIQSDKNEGRKLHHKIVIICLDTIILACLKEQAMSGYDLIESIHNKFNVLLSPGTIYPVLDSLKRSGLVEVFFHNKKRLHRLTNEGIKFSKTFSAKYKETQRRILALLNR